MSKLRPYIALDLETTGLNREKSEVLQIGAVLDDGVTPIEELSTLNILVDHETIAYGEKYALGLNGWIFQEIAKKPEERTHKYRVEGPQAALYSFSRLLKRCAALAEIFDEGNGEKGLKQKVQIAGKNPGSFDWPILCNMAERSFNPKEFQTKYVDHRFIDVGCIFFSRFGKNPGLNDINKLTGRDAVTHDALEDALDIVHAVRKNMEETLGNN